MNVMLETNLPRRIGLEDDPIEILRFARAALSDGHDVALATVTEIRGGAPRPVGTQMAIRSDGGFIGFISGGCLEAAVASEAVAAIRAGDDRTVKYGLGSPYFDIVLPCGGGVTITIHVLRDGLSIDQVLASVDQRRPAAMVYAGERQSLSAGPIDCMPAAGLFGFTVVYRPKCRIVLQGAAAEVHALARLGLAAGYEVVVHEAGSHGEVDPDTAVALLHHDIEREVDLIRVALSGGAFYIGALGSARTHERRKQMLAANGFTSVEIARIKAPIGLFSRARDTSSLAISVLADIAHEYGRRNQPTPE